MFDGVKPRLASLDEHALLLDAFGLGDHESEPAPESVDLRNSGAMTFAPTVADAIMFGRPLAGAPACFGIDYQLFEGGYQETGARGRGPAHHRWILGPLPDAIDIVRYDVLGADPEPTECFFLLLTELLVNAIGHRSYAPPYINEPVRVAQYSDAIVICSPGCPPRPVDAEDGITGRFSRNPTLMASLVRRRLARQQGKGLSVAQQLARGAGYVFSLTATTEAVEAKLVVAPWRWDDSPPRSPKRLPGGTRARAVIGLLETVPEANAALISTRLKMPRPTLSVVLRQLVADKKVERTCEAPRSRNQAYRLTVTFREELQRGGAH